MKGTLKIAGIVAALLVLAVGGYGLYLYKEVNDTANKVHEPLEREPEREPTLTLKEPLSFLLLGVDERDGDKGRSDTIVVMTVNPEEESLLMFNIPRDTRTEIVDRGTEDKINHAYAFGGVPMAVKTVEQFLNIPIDYYVKVNMEAFKEIVDAVDGVTVTNPFAFSQSGFHFPKGAVTLNGDEALAYSRMRYHDPEGDLGRNKRQQQIIKAILKKGGSFTGITRFGTILSSLEENVKTNITFADMRLIHKHYRQAANATESFEVKGTGQRMNDIYYYIVSDEERRAISKRLRRHLEIEE